MPQRVPHQDPVLQQRGDLLLDDGERPRAAAGAQVVRCDAGDGRAVVGHAEDRLHVAVVELVAVVVHQRDARELRGEGGRRADADHFAVERDVFACCGSGGEARVWDVGMVGGGG